MPRNPKQNAQVREARMEQILDAALTVYLRLGYHGTDMDTVAEEAQLAKGLIYYYFKTKRELFAALYTQLLDASFALSARLLRSTEGRDAVDRLMAYTYALFLENRQNRRLMQFCMRIPFDAYAIFSPDEWKEGVQKSDIHREALAGIIKQGIFSGSIPPTEPNGAALSFWSVFVANVFSYTRLIAGEKKPGTDPTEEFQRVVQFCFQGLGIAADVWTASMQTILLEKQQEAI